jgi:hypothetical protein
VCRLRWGGAHWSARKGGPRRGERADGTPGHTACVIRAFDLFRQAGRGKYGLVRTDRTRWPHARQACRLCLRVGVSAARFSLIVLQAARCRLANKGSWVDGRTFVLERRFLGNGAKVYWTLQFEGDQLNLRFRNTDGYAIELRGEPVN